MTDAWPDLFRLYEQSFGGGKVEHQAQHQSTARDSAVVASTVDQTVPGGNYSNVDGLDRQTGVPGGQGAKKTVAASLQPALTGAQLRFVGLWLLAALVIIGGYFTLTREAAGKLRSASTISAPKPISAAHASPAEVDVGEAPLQAEGSASRPANEFAAAPATVMVDGVAPASTGATLPTSLQATLLVADEAVQQVRRLDAAFQDAPVSSAGSPKLGAAASVRATPTSTDATTGAVVATPRLPTRSATAGVTRGVRPSCGDALAAGALSDSMSAEEQERARLACR